MDLSRFFTVLLVFAYNICCIFILFFNIFIIFSIYHKCTILVIFVNDTNFLLESGFDYNSTIL